ncbi:pyridoxal 5'-phosphate synthase glutaminase subunit PdxT [Methanoplanus sp. FWC-SCC4]|uniref:Pyridoxal 5'-phosphate synthase subunit PdxT n=1 Tax=Methanochimaera problematica TaxID=2609417 RepID=A0AA97FEB9_9EURY|nr:pyridoxal 5'-phosphate synthase glutaminase subunit PdxT [Methanoplanus sp. FWC-SCC4]WOF16669.1 pyridoxal 5'-phosphate synthase glutaminase subunit PdxT [Methanoplanus sp. FWC-SCC4]
MGIKIGVLALQGDVSEHILAFERALLSAGLKTADSSVFELRNSDEIPVCDAIAIPGGESTTISRLIDKNGMRDALVNFKGGFFATCAGMVILSSEADDKRVKPLGIIDISVDRNAFGRQRDSFQMPLEIRGLSAPYDAVFIRAPVAVSAGKDVFVLCKLDSGIVALTQGKHMVLSFHPELTGDTRLHELFLKNLVE